MAKNNRKFNNWWLWLAGVVLLAIAVVLLTLFLTQGETKISGKYPKNESLMSLTCKSNDAEYGIFVLDEASARDIEIAINYNDTKLKSISLKTTQYFSDYETAKRSEAHNHAAMNTAFGKDGLESDALNATYSTQKDKFQMTLYSEATNFNDKTAKYFLANGAVNNSPIETLKKNYEKQGFNCN